MTNAPLNSSSNASPSDASNSSSLDQRLAMVQQLEAGGQLAAAQDLLEQAPEEDRRHGLFHYVRGALALRRGDLDAAVSAFEQAVTLGPPLPEYLANLGAALLARSRQLTGEVRWEEQRKARQALERAAELGPKLPHAFSNLGLARLLDGDYAGAAAACDAALDIDPLFADALFNKAAAVSRGGDRQGAIALLDQLLQLQPDHAAARGARERLLAK